MVSEKKREAIDRYDAKTYAHIHVRLRIEDDADIIKSRDAAKAEGLNHREWLRKIFDNQR